MEHNESDTLDTKPSVQESPKAIWKRWITELAIADKAEEEHRKTAQETIDIYKNKNKNIRFNILYSNVQTVSPALYLNTPRPDVRQRFADQDPAAKEASETLERTLIAQIDSYDFDYTAKGIVLDYQLTGRGIGWIDYEPKIVETPVPSMDENGFPTVEMAQEIAYQQVKCRWIEWDKIRFGQANRWEDTPWIRIEHYFTREEMIEQFGEEIGSVVKLDLSYEDDKDKDEKDSDAIKRGLVYEIWSKLDRMVYFICPSYEEGPLLVKPDPYNLEGFFPCPRPMLYVSDPDCQKPIIEYTLYKDLAQELDLVTKRIKTLTASLKVRGIYDSNITDMAKILEGDDADLIPSANASAAMQMGGLEKAVWMFPIEGIVRVLMELYKARDQIKGAIYEITGISDILRGQSDPNETAKAQGIKAQFGGLRIQERQMEVQRFMRDLFRIKSELIAEKFEPNILSLIIGKPVAPETIELLRSDLHRTIRVDVETDSTIAQDAESDKRNITELLTSITQFVGAWGPIIQSGMVPMEVPKALLMAATKRFKMGREVEDALNLIGQQQLPPQMPQGAPVVGAQSGEPLPPQAVTDAPNGMPIQ